MFKITKLSDVVKSFEDEICRVLLLLTIAVIGKHSGIVYILDRRYIIKATELSAGDRTFLVFSTALIVSDGI